MNVDDPWPRRVILASSRIYDFTPVSHEASDDDDFVELFGPLVDDNSSYNQCPGFCVPCSDDQPMWWLVLRWLKMMLLKIARSYHAKPLLLVIAPLLVGIAIGYFLGSTRRESPPKTFNGGTTSFVSHPEMLVSPTRIVRRIRDFVAVICFRVIVWLDIRMDSQHLLNVDQQLDSRIVRSENEDQLQALLTRETQPEIPLSANKEDLVRTNLQSDDGTTRESGVDASQVPGHVAVIMDGNRRYGKAKYGNVSQGHWDGSSKLVEFAKWCIAEEISVLTVYAFSTENWNRDPAEVASLMAIFAKYCDELRLEALKRNIQIRVLCTDSTRIPANVKDGLSRMSLETKHCTGLVLNICMSYGSRSEILNAARSIASDVASGRITARSVDEAEFEKHLLTNHCSDPDVLIRTSGEVRISNFLLWQMAYSEMFFVDKPWPLLDKQDLLQVIRTYAKGRIRRFGK